MEGVKLEYKHIKRIEDSEHFGTYLQVDLFNIKTCTFNCIHCRGGPTKNQIPQRVYIYPVNKILKEINDNIEKFGKVDYIKYSHRGDPTLYVLFGKLNREIRAAHPDVKIATCTNCSMVERKDISDELKQVDLVIASLDSVINEEFQRINQPLEQINLEVLLQNLQRFREDFSGQFWLNTILLRDYNDSDQSISAMKNYLQKLLPDNYLITFETTDSSEIFPQELKVKLVEAFVDTPYDVQIGADRP